MMTNAIGMKVAQLAGVAGANHIVPVNLYINGEYRGSYNFTEKIGFHNNSIDLDDETSSWTPIVTRSSIAPIIMMCP